MRQIDLTLSSQCSDMLGTEPIKQPLMNIGLESDIELKGNIIEDAVLPVLQKEVTYDVETVGVIVTEESSRSSPRSSRSSSLNSYDTKVRVSNGPGYERNLLKKRLLVPEISVENPSSDEFRLDDETRAKILDYKSDHERPGALRRKYSFNDKLKGFAVKDKTSTMKKLIKSPSFIRKSYSFKNHDSNVSSSAAETTTSVTEKRKKRRLSIGKRRKTSKYQADKQTVENAKVEKPERSTKFRRKKLVKSHSDSSLTLHNVNKSKLILLYSGDSPIKNDKINHKNRLGMLKQNDSIESSSEYDEYSSALSDGESNNGIKSRKARRGVAKRVWKSINNLLFVADDQSPPKSSFFSTPPLLRRNPTKSNSKYRSMPGGLNRVKSFSGQKSNMLKVDDSLVMDDLSLLKKKKISLDESSLASQAVSKFQKLLKLSHGRLNEESGTKRSKSMDFLLDTYSVRRKDSSDTDWFEPRKKAHSTLTPHEHIKKAAKNGLQYKIIISQEPKQIEKKKVEPDAKPLTKSSTRDNDATNKSQTKANDRRREYIKVRLEDMKLLSQKEMETFLSKKKFKPEHVNDWCRVLSESIKERIVKITADTHKIVAQVFIGALCDDGIHAAIQCTSGQKTGEKAGESFFSVTYKGKDLFAVASVFTFEL